MFCLPVHACVTAKDQTDGESQQTKQHSSAAAGSHRINVTTGASYLTHHFVHFELGVGFGAEEFVGARRDKLFHHVGEQQEVVEKEAVQLLAALRLVELAAVQEFPWSQAVRQGIENWLLQEKKSPLAAVN